MKAKGLSIAVVGHTNTGKTSLLRTLLRDEEFGEIKDQAATTRHVEAAVLLLADDREIEIADTPGLEDAGGMLDWLEAHTSERSDGVERLNALLADAVGGDEFAQEAKVLRQVLRADAALYVVDAREPVLAKYKDELSILAMCGKPLMPVFNFCRHGNAAAWHEVLARRGLHVASEFDSVAFDFASEQRLWQQLAVLLGGNAVISQWQNERNEQWQQLQQHAAARIADFLLQTAALSDTVTIEQTDAAWQRMQNTVREGEAAMQQDLLHLFRFYRERGAVLDEHLPQICYQDVFDAALWKRLGVRTGTGAAVGALIGLGVDVASVGLSGGLGTAIGSMLGGMLSGGGSVSGRLRGEKTVLVDAAALSVLAMRAVALWQALRRRGHASQQDWQVDEVSPVWQSKRLPPPLQRARSHPDWTAHNRGVNESKAAVRRAAAVRELQGELLAAVQQNPL